MLDVGFSELLLIGVVALVVVGPERLPRLARTAGQWIGRAQRYVNDVKSDISREVELDELRRLRAEMEATARNMQETMTSHAAKLENEFRSVDSELQGIGRDLDAAADALDNEVKRNTTGPAPAPLAAPASGSTMVAGAPADAAPPARDPMDDELERAIAAAEWMGNYNAAPSPAPVAQVPSPAPMASVAPHGAATQADLLEGSAVEVDPRQGVLPLFDSRPEPVAVAAEPRAAKDSTA